MTRALELAVSPGVPRGPNPRVGCVVLDSSGGSVGEGFHAGAGTAHAEINALAAAGAQARGATLVVTLEPCNHFGRTGPCAQAIVDAGIARVVYAQSDPNVVAQGGAQFLRSAGIEVVGGLDSEPARQMNLEWSMACERGWPFVTLKLAASLDGRIAAMDGSSRWITGPAARRDVHSLRNDVDAVVTGTGTVLADDPELTVREVPVLGGQPIRVVVGERPIPQSARIFNDKAETVVMATHDVDLVLKTLFEHSVRHVLVEGGATLAAAFIKANRVDRVRWYVAPAVLGSGPAAVADLGITTIGAATRWRIDAVGQIGADVRIDLAIPGPGSDNQCSPE